MGIVFLRTKVLHGAVFTVVFEVRFVAQAV